MAEDPVVSPQGAHRVESAEDRASGTSALRRFIRSARSWRLRTAIAEPGLDRRSTGMVLGPKDRPRGVLAAEPIEKQIL